MRGKIKQCDGFTLVELIVVIIIVMIFAGGTTFYINRINENSLINRVAYQLLTDVRYIQEMAMNHNESIDFSVTSSSYTATWESGGTVTSDFSGSEFGSDVYSQFGATISGSSFTVDAGGVPDSDVVLTISAGASGYKTIYVSGDTGFSYLD